MRNKKFVVGGLVVIPIAAFFVWVEVSDAFSPQFLGAPWPGPFNSFYLSGIIMFAVILDLSGVSLGYGLTHRTGS